MIVPKVFVLAKVFVVLGHLRELVIIAWMILQHRRPVLSVRQMLIVDILPLMNKELVVMELVLTQTKRFVVELLVLLIRHRQIPFVAT
jgi:hypothetical protein